MTLAGLTGNILVAVVAAFMVGLGCAFSEGAIFAQVPSMFPDNSSSVAGIVGGIGSSGGVIFSTTLLPSIHLGYAVVGATMISIIALSVWMFQPHIAERATVDGWVVSDTEPASQPAPIADD